jgi:hypothetical protein
MQWFAICICPTEKITRIAPQELHLISLEFLFIVFASTTMQQASILGSAIKSYIPSLEFLLKTPIE